MQKVNFIIPAAERKAWASFTLVELLVVMVIIGVLAGLTLMAAGQVWNTSSRARARDEIQAMSAGLDNYKIDNGSYPTSTNLLGGTTGAYAVNPTTTGTGSYQESSQYLYQALAGTTNFTIAPTGKYYMSFKTSQLGNYTATLTTYVKDPWGYSYGYSTGDGTTVNIPCAGSNFFDLWSTGGLTANPTSKNASDSWITNWKP